MATLLERLRDAVAPEYDVERELASGGMGVVFLARQVTLDRPVAIKVLRPEQATAAAAERFLREARMLASVRHPNVVSIYHVGQKGGLFYFVMERLEGSLTDRLEAGPLAPADVERLGVALLDGLAKAHACGIVHRDVKPSNIFFRDDVPVLGDFGIAKQATGADESLTQPGHTPGTPAYMAPEQLAASGVTPATDLYAVGMVLYEACTGRHWEGIGDPEQADWSRVPAHLASVLKQALALEPERRWRETESFARALVPPPPRPWGRWVALGGVAIAVVAVVVAVLLSGSAGRTTSDIAVLPLAMADGGRDLGEALATVTELHLEKAFRADTVHITPVEQSAEWWYGIQMPESLPQDAWRILRTGHIAHGWVTRRGDSLYVRMEVVQPDARPRPVSEVAGTAGDLNGLGYRMAAALVRAIWPEKAADFVGNRELAGRSAEAVRDLLQGDAAFRQENWSAAERSYRQAIARDSSLAQAWWGLYNVERWRRESTDDVDLAAVYERYASNFPDLDALLIRADLETGAQAVRIYREAVEAYSYDAYPWLLLGNDLFHRGALLGIGHDSAVAVLEQAIARNPFLAPAYSTLAWALIRQGDSARARAAVDRYTEVAYPMTEPGLCIECALPIIWALRFAPETGDEQQSEIFKAVGGMEALLQTLRLGLSFGVPRAQLEIGQALAAALPAADQRADAVIAQGLALVSLGRVQAALERFDSAAAVLGSDELGVEAAEWRVVLPALGVPGVSEAERAHGREVLTGATTSSLGGRASWALAVDAAARGDLAAAEGWVGRLQPGDTLTARLRTLAGAVLLSARDSTERALAESDTLLPFAVGNRLGDPFARAVLYVMRGEWLERLGRRGADAAWLWYENADWHGWLEGPIQAAEVDEALETYGRARRVRRALAHGDRALACRVAVEIPSRWRNADTAYAALRRESTVEGCVR